MKSFTMLNEFIDAFELDLTITGSGFSPAILFDEGEIKDSVLM